MRQRKAKLLRRMAQAGSAGAPDRQQARTVRGNVINTGCTRELYREYKRIFKHRKHRR